MTYVLEQEISRTAVVQCLHPINCTLGCVDDSHTRLPFAGQKGVATDVIRPNPKGVNGFLRVNMYCAVMDLCEV